MRRPRRAEILAATVELLEQHGVAALTFDAVSKRTGITRNGIIHHYKSKDDLLLAAYGAIIERWEHDLSLQIDGTHDDACAEERLVAYLATHTAPAPKATLQLLLEVASHPQLGEHWQRVQQTWAPAPDSLDRSDITRLIVRLAAQGLLLQQAVARPPLDDALVQAVTSRLTALLADETD